MCCGLVDIKTAAFFVRGVLAINGHILGKEDGGGVDKDRRVEEEERLKIQLADFEKKLLTALGSSTGNILENKPLIASLE